MPLINCPECKKEISDKAYACPNCGNPINEQKTTIQIDPAPKIRREYRKRDIIFGAMFLLGLFLGFMSIFTAPGFAFIFFVIAFIGFIGSIINSIGAYLNKP